MTAADPERFACVECEGRESEGCTACGGTGEFRVEECPLVFAADWLGVTFAAEQAEHGCWPGGPGWMDEVGVVLDGIRFAMGELARWRGVARQEAEESVGRRR